MKKRILSIALTLCMLLSVVPLTPIVATASTTTTATEKDITLGTSAIQDPTEVTTDSGKYYTPNSYIYFGMNGTAPIKWRVLDADKTNDGTTAGMFLLSEYVLATGVQFDAGFNNNYQGSDAQSWCSNFAANSSNFSITEQNAMQGVAKTDSTESLYSLSWGASSLTTADKVFFLSTRELADYVGNYVGAPGLAATDAAQASACWWLRSPSTGSSSAGFVGEYGAVIANDAVIPDGVRPALNLNSSKILFTSAAVGGKSSNAAAGGVVENKNYTDITGNDGYKLTLLDESRSGFSAYLKSVSGNTATVSYSGAKTGTNEYISVIIKNGTDVKYYGRVAALSDASAASGDVDITLPSDYSTANGDVLCVFNEQYNGDKNTDYASDVVVLPDYRWYTNNTSATEFTISTVSELLGFANLVNGTSLPDGVDGHINFFDKTVKLLNDLDLSCIPNWTPIGSLWKFFAGIFDGDGHKITGLSVNCSADYVGLFGFISRMADDNCYIGVKNLSVSGNVTAPGDSSRVGGIVGCIQGAIRDFAKIENCSFSGTVKGNGRNAGGIVGFAIEAVILKCRNTATVSGSANYIGGIVGTFDCSDIGYCCNHGNITSDFNNAYVGGMVGYVSFTYRDNIRSCYSTGTITATGTNAKVGGSVGYAKTDEYDLNIDGVYYFDSTAGQCKVKMKK